MMSVFNSQMAQKQWAGRQTDKKKEGKKAGRKEKRGEEQGMHACLGDQTGFVNIKSSRQKFLSSWYVYNSMICFTQ